MVSNIDQLLAYVTAAPIGRKVTTDLYVKLTDSKQYLDSSSCHPYHYKKKIP